MKHFSTLSNPLGAAAVIIVSTFGLIGCSSFDSIRDASASSQSQSITNNSGNDRIKRHVYAGIGVGSSRLNPNAGDAPDFKVNERTAVGRQISLGVDVSRHLAVEFHSADLGSAGLSPNGRIEYSTLGASALLYAGKNRHNYKRQGFSGFGRIGFGRLNGSAIGDVNLVMKNDTHVLVGAGLEYTTRVGLGLRAEAISFDEDARYMQLGLIYRLGRKSENRPVEIAKVATPEPLPKPVPKPIPKPVPAVAAAKKPITQAQAIDICKQLSGTLNGVNFHSNSQSLTGSAMGVLDGVAKQLRDCPSIPVEVSAHTDSHGSNDFNLKLSARRAATVAKYLHDGGISRGRLKVKAYGESQPIDTNATAKGRERNRRVELNITQ